ncbi:Uncharacterised protein [Chryseobacterium nakagawai]|uniref:hypothetical protein n=1 Tax=Chryseobacterium nakagawai TaxID=1241982 RepID=UPI000F4DC225|nr:hypothetical protein [Chryseobacterium nakagawai]VEH22395.1 Uncharacterised protein [Chryseobacterium nakagawai]
MRKLPRTKLKDINGKGRSCDFCPTSGNYGDGPEYTNGCMAFWALSPTCRNCVDVSADCYGPDYSDYYGH